MNLAITWCRAAGICLHQGMGGSGQQDGPEDEAVHSTGEHSHPNNLRFLLRPCFLRWICNLPVFDDPQDPTSVG